MTGRSSPRAARRSGIARAPASTARSARPPLSGALIGKGNHRHFMEKEMWEQPGGARGHAPGLCQSVEPHGFAAADALRLEDAAEAHHRGLRHRLLRRHGRQILVRAGGAASGRDRYRVGVPLSRRAAARGRGGPLRLAVGGNHRHARGARLCALLQAAHSLGRECARERDGAEVRLDLAHPRRSGDLRRLYQGHHGPADGACLPGDRRRRARETPSPRRKRSGSWAR